MYPLRLVLCNTVAILPISHKASKSIQNTLCLRIGHLAIFRDWSAVILGHLANFFTAIKVVIIGKMANLERQGIRRIR